MIRADLPISILPSWILRLPGKQYMVEKDKNNLKQTTKSSVNPEGEEDDFFEALDHHLGISDEQLKAKELEETKAINIDEEVTQALQTLSPEDQEVYERTGIIHFERSMSVEKQIHNAIELQKKNEAHQKAVLKTILYLMLIGIVFCIGGLYISAHLTSTAASSSKAKNPYAVAEDEAAVKINEINFPDAVFRDYIKKNADTNSDGILSPEERNSFVILSIFGDPQLTNVKGIEYFPLLQAVNLSNTGLTEIQLENNKLLDNINISGTKVTSLDLSKDAELTKVNVANTALQTLILPAPSKVTEVTVTNTTMVCSKDESNYYNACSVKQ